MEATAEKHRFALTEQAVAEAVPHARRLAPRPATFDARRKGEVDPHERHQQVAHADVGQQQVGGRPQPLEAAVERQHREVVAEAEHADGADGDRQQPVGVHGEQVLLGAPRAPAVVGRTHRARVTTGCRASRCGSRCGRTAKQHRATPAAARAALASPRRPFKPAPESSRKVGQCAAVKRALCTSHFRRNFQNTSKVGPTV